MGAGGAAIEKLGRARDGGPRPGGAGFIGLGLYVRTHVRTAVYVYVCTYVSGRSDTSLMAASFFGLLVALSKLMQIKSAKATSPTSRHSEAEADAQARTITSGRISKKQGRGWGQPGANGQEQEWERERGLGRRRGANLGEAWWREVVSKMHISAGKGKYVRK